MPLPFVLAILTALIVDLAVELLLYDYGSRK